MSINEPTISSHIVRPTQVIIDINRLRENFHAIRKHVHDAKILAVLKANAYGHGLVRCARLYQDLNADYLGVAVLEEGILLRENGITCPILVLGGVLGNQIPAFIHHDLTITASSIDKLQQIEAAAKQLGKQAKVHLKIDTGMERIGVHYYNAHQLLAASLSCRHVFIEGIYSHFANADDENLAHAELQFERFNNVLTFYSENNITRPPLCHIANSGAILQLPQAQLDMVRPGILLYGVYPSAKVKRSVPVRPALTWKSNIVYFKVITPGHPVGYGSRWQSEKNTRAVTVPVGYGDGYFRAMSHKASVLINGNAYPVIGTISMDQIVVNIGNDSAFNGDDVILVGEQQGKSIHAEDLADWADTIPYEILTNINTRVPRIYIE